MRGGGAFTEYSVESLSLPETIQTIDDEALKGVPSLKHVQISPKCEGFISFDDMLFTKDYSQLLLIPEGKEGAASLPDQSTLVSATAFSRCSVLSQILVGDSATFTTYDGVLYSKDMKTLVACPAGIGASIVIPVETETIDKDALAGCKDLASITALGNVQKINPTAFTDETKATAVVALPAGQDYNARKATWEQAGFQNFAKPAKPGETTNQDTNEATGLTYTLLDDYTLSVSWQGKDDPEANLEIPASAEINGVPYRVSTIAENAFANRGSLTSVKLPSTITTINNAAFVGCANLSTIDFPNTLCEIGERAFEATSLKDVWLPTSMKSIGSRAFASCSTLERVVALGTPQVATDALAGCTNVSIYVPSGSEDAWNPGLPSDNNHLMSYGITLSEEPLAIEAGQEANLLEGGNLQAPDPVEASYSYAAAPLSVDAGTVSAKKAGTTDVTAVLTLDNKELARASRTVEVSSNPNARNDIALLNAETPMISAYLADLREASAPINVDAPIAVIFGQDAPYDVATQPDSIESSASYRNNMDIPLQLAKIDCSINGASTNLTPINNDFSLDKQRLFSLYPEGKVDEAVSFGYGPNINTGIPDNPSAFVIPPGSSSTYTFRLNLTNDLTLANAKVNPGIADGGFIARELASVVCTFEQYKGSFYLKDKNTGSLYTLTQVKEHANDIAAKGSDSPYYNQYKGYIRDDTSYICQSVWGVSTPYDVRVIGIDHDVKTDGSKTGITFQFRDLLRGWYPINATKNTTEGGWGVCELRANMNPGKDDIPYGTDTNLIWDYVPSELQDAIEVVKKDYNPIWDDANGSSLTASEDKLFLLSLVELRGLNTGSAWNTTYPWTTREGSQYEYYSYLNIALQNNTCLIKDSYWALRSVAPFGEGEYFLGVTTNGDPTWGGWANTTSWSVCPCFCL